MKNIDGIWRFRNLREALQTVITRRYIELESYLMSNIVCKEESPEILSHVVAVQDRLQRLINGEKREVQPDIEYLTYFLRELETYYVSQ